jgi:hypothetical protein
VAFAAFALVAVRADRLSTVVTDAVTVRILALLDGCPAHLIPGSGPELGPYGRRPEDYYREQRQNLNAAFHNKLLQ